MRSILFLACFSAAAAVDEVQCTFNAAQSVDEMIDAAVFLWAAVDRCGKANSQIDCTVDVATVIQSLNGMANVIVKALDDCGGIKSDKCGQAAGGLTESLAGITAASAGVVDQCSSRSRQNDHPGGDMILCVVNVKDATRSLLQMIDRGIDASKSCNGAATARCGGDVTSVMSALAAMSQYISGAVARCSPQPLAEKTEIDLDCSKQLSAFLRHSAGLASASAKMSYECGSSSSRLYEVQKQQQTATTTSPITLALFAFLPITAVIAFVGGSRFAKGRGPRFSREIQLSRPVE